MWGQDGNDTLYGGTGNDDMYGELGNDYMDGGPGEDVMLATAAALSTTSRPDQEFTIILSSVPQEPTTACSPGPTTARSTSATTSTVRRRWNRGLGDDDAQRHDGRGDDVMVGGPAATRCTAVPATT